MSMYFFPKYLCIHSCVSFRYDYDNADSFECIKNLLTSNDELFSQNYIVMVIRNKVDSKEIITESESECNEQFKQITAINNEIYFVKNFSAKNKSVEKIEKVFIKSIELYREYYSDQLPASGGAKKKKKLKSDTYNDAKSPSPNQSSNADIKTNENEKEVAAEQPNDSGCSCIVL